MPADCPEDITGLFVVWSEGGGEAIKDVLSVVYPELRRIAHQYLRYRAPTQTLESAALAHEMYLKMIRARGIRCENCAHFFALCAQMIRRILVDHARHSRYAKGGADAVCVPLDEVLLGTGATAARFWNECAHSGVAESSTVADRQVVRVPNAG